MPNNIHQHNTLPAPPQQRPTLRPPTTPRPLLPPLKSLLRPPPETDLLHHRRRRDLLAQETTPRHRMHRLRALLARLEEGGAVRGRGRGRAAAAAAIVVDAALGGVGAEVGAQVLRPVGEGAEEFDKWFLEDETAGGAPAVGGVGAGDAVDGGLGGDGPPSSALRQGEQVVADDCRFGGEGGGRAIAPGELGGVVGGKVRGEEGGYLRGVCGFAPESAGLGGGAGEGGGRVRHWGSECGRTRVTEAAVGEVVPGRRARVGVDRLVDVAGGFGVVGKRGGGTVGGCKVVRGYRRTTT